MNRKSYPRLSPTEWADAVLGDPTEALASEQVDAARKRELEQLGMNEAEWNRDVEQVVTRLRQALAESAAARAEGTPQAAARPRLAGAAKEVVLRIRDFLSSSSLTLQPAGVLGQEVGDSQEVVSLDLSEAFGEEALSSRLPWARPQLRLIAHHESSDPLRRHVIAFLTPSDSPNDADGGAIVVTLQSDSRVLGSATLGPRSRSALLASLSRDVAVQDLSVQLALT